MTSSRATGNVIYSGTIRCADGVEHVLKCSSSAPYAKKNVLDENPVFTATVVGDQTFQIGGTSDRGESGEYDRNKSYKFGGGGWAEVVELPPGTTFTCEVRAFGDVYSEAVIKVTIHEGSDLKELEYQYRLAVLNAQYGKEKWSLQCWVVDCEAAGGSAN